MMAVFLSTFSYFLNFHITLNSDVNNLQYTDQLISQQFFSHRAKVAVVLKPFGQGSFDPLW